MAAIKKQHKTTKHLKLLELFLKNGNQGVTSWDAIEYAHYTRLAAWVYAMKKRGYIIMSIINYENKTRYARYWILATPLKGNHAYKRHEKSAINH